MGRRAPLGGLALAVVVSASCSLPAAKVVAPPEAAVHVTTGGVLSVGITPPAGVEPTSFYEPASVLVANVLCDTLVAVDPETGEVRPGLLIKWTLTNDGSRAIFQLRRDAYFHDGRQVKSADIVDSWKRVASPENASTSAELLAGVRGYAEFRKGVEEGIPSADFFGLRIIEPFSFEVLLARRDPDFLRRLAHPSLAPVSKAPYDADAKAASAHPQCAGPYKLEAAYEAGASEIKLRRFEQYYAKNNSYVLGGRGFADEIRFRIYPDAEAVYQAHIRGEVDVAGVPSSRVTEARARFGPRLHVGDVAQAEFIGLPHGQGSPFADPEVRIALSQALDRTRIAKEVYGDARRPANGFLPPALSTRLKSRTIVKEVTFGCGDSVPVAGNPAQARERWARTQAVSTSAPPSAPASPTAPGEILTGASGGGGVAGAVSLTPLTLYFNDEGPHRRLVESVAAQWREVLGLEVEVVPLTWDAYLQKGTVGSGFDGAFRMSYVAPYTSAQGFLGPLFLTRSTNSGNLARYSNLAFDEALAEDTVPVIDEQERVLRYRQLEDMLCGDVPIIPIAFAQAAYAFREGVTPVRSGGRVLSRDAVLLLREVPPAR